MKSLELKKDIYWVGAFDPNLRIFDIIMETQFGTTYNSYIVKGSEKTAIFETVKVKFFDKYVEKLKSILGDLNKVDYIVVDHTEPDHAGSVEKLLELIPHAKVVGSQAAIDFLADICNREIDSIVVEHGDTLNLGNKTLKFISAPFLHWPDSIYTYVPEDNLLFTCDSFGSHYSFDQILYSKIPTEKHDDYMSALLYYYTAIFGPFKKYVLEAIDKIKDFNIDMICTGHGPVLDKNPLEIVEIYKKWSIETNSNEKPKIVIPYVSAYGYTEEIAEKIIEGINSFGDFDIKKYNINIANYGELKQSIMNEIYWADGILLGTSTINGDALPPIWDIAISLNPIVHGGKIASAFGSYGWSGEGVPNIIDRFEQLRMNVVDPYRIKFKPSKDELLNAVEFGKKFAEYVTTGQVPPRKQEEIELLETLNPSGEIKKWRCLVCGEIFEGVLPPMVCPACGVGQELFEVIEETSAVLTTSEAEENIIIIGNGAAGISAAEAARERNKNANIEIIAKASIDAYYRPSISDFLGDNVTLDELYLKEKSWYIKNNIKVSLNTLIEKIDTNNKTIYLGDSTKRKYDKLIIATGSRSNIPPILGVEKPGTYTLRGKVDADRIKENLKTVNKIAVVGGGILGLEVASEIAEMGKEVIIVEMEARIFPKQLDEEGSVILEEIIKNRGIKLYKNHFVRKINGNEKVTGIELDNGKSINVDMVIISAGIRCNKELAERSGIITNYGIVVNNKMETNVKDVYACGDVAEFEGIVQGLWKTALEQGKVAGANAVGDDLTYTLENQPVTFSGLDTEIFSIGDIGNDPEKNYQISVYNDPINKVYKKAYFENNKFVGGVLIGDITAAGSLLSGIKLKSDMKELTKKLYK
ncbi:flavorubredoxin [Hypnocyclicus thermotrophus]|uniref:Flavorubredoxin n=1 Tax=Hypnocyclicus thermotrophus TaxID=1627895 RepID=A0AA46E0Y1_9FUSO|nr:FAD-dependent oxidoreductase [Hypnocyclicus thermotrophus]TDT72388.1 flavorubredoxin [Hypnocyclicus thermotrophus]